MFATVKNWFAKELSRLFRFGIIGALTFVIYYACYYLLSEMVWKQGNHTLQNVIATVLGSSFNFFAHRHWTFRSQGGKMEEAKRYLVVAVTAVALEVLLFWIADERLHIQHLIAAVAVPIVIPLYTYAMHRTYTFRPISAIPPNPVL